MNYRKIYLNIIEKAKLKSRKRDKSTYYEAHHILPKSLFPLWAKRKSNIVLLTAREHFFCHQLLDKIYPGEKMFFALWVLANDGQNNYCVKGSREYQRLKERCSTLVRLQWVGKSFEERFGLVRASQIKQKISESKLGHSMSEETKEKIKISKILNNSTNKGKKIKDFYSAKSLQNFYNGQSRKKGKYHHITNGKENHLVPKGSLVPDGFWIGYTYLKNGTSSDSIPIRCISNGKIYSSIQKASIDLEISRGGIKKILLKKIKNSRLLFEYII